MFKTSQDNKVGFLETENDLKKMKIMWSLRIYILMVWKGNYRWTVCRVYNVYFNLDKPFILSVMSSVPCRLSPGYILYTASITILGFILHCNNNNPGYILHCNNTNPGYILQCNNTNPGYILHCNNTNPGYILHCNNTNPGYILHCNNTNPGYILHCNNTNPGYILNCNNTNPRFHPTLQH